MWSESLYLYNMYIYSNICNGVICKLTELIGRPCLAAGINTETVHLLFIHLVHTSKPTHT